MPEQARKPRELFKHLAHGAIALSTLLEEFERAPSYSMKKTLESVNTRLKLHGVILSEEQQKILTGTLKKLKDNHKSVRETYGTFKENVGELMQIVFEFEPKEPAALETTAFGPIVTLSESDFEKLSRKEGSNHPALGFVSMGLGIVKKQDYSEPGQELVRALFGKPTPEKHTFEHEKMHLVWEAMRGWYGPEQDLIAGETPPSSPSEQESKRNALVLHLKNELIAHVCSNLSRAEQYHNVGRTNLAEAFSSRLTRFPMFPSIADIHKRLMEADQKTDWRTVSKKNIAVVLKTANAGYNLIDIFPAMLVLPYNKIHLLPHVLEQIKKIKEGIEK